MKKLNIRFFSILIIIWIVDFVSKYWVYTSPSFKGNKVIQVIGDFFQIRLVFNTGGVFGIFQGNSNVFHILTGVAILFLMIYYFMNPEKNKLYNIAINFILAGALGNFTDRFYFVNTKGQKAVVDFLDVGINFHRWPTFNIADSFISVGAVLLAIAFIQIEKAERQKQLESE